MVETEEASPGLLARESGGLDDSNHKENREKYSDSRFIAKIETVGFPDS